MAYKMLHQWASLPLTSLRVTASPLPPRPILAGLQLPACQTCLEYPCLRTFRRFLCLTHSQDLCVATLSQPLILAPYPMVLPMLAPSLLPSFFTFLIAPTTPPGLAVSLAVSLSTSLGPSHSLKYLQFLEEGLAMGTEKKYLSYQRMNEYLKAYTPPQVIKKKPCSFSQKTNFKLSYGERHWEKSLGWGTSEMSNLISITEMYFPGLYE